MADFILWHCLSPVAQRKLRERFPFFNLPIDNWSKINSDCEMESIEEIDKLMRIPTKWGKRPPC